MEIVKSDQQGPASSIDDDVVARSWIARLLAWPGNAGDRALDRDPTLWMHRDVIA